MNKSQNKYIKSTRACISTLIEGDKFHENEKDCAHPNSGYKLYLKFDAHRIIISSAEFISILLSLETATENLVCYKLIISSANH